MPRRFLLAFILTLACAVCVSAQERRVWQIGEFDGSSDEFGAQAVKLRVAKLGALPGVREIGVAIEREAGMPRPA